MAGGYAGCRCVIPMHAPAPALYRGMMPLTPVPTASSLITPLPPHCHPNTMVQTGGKTPRSQVPSGPAAIDTITPTAPNAVTTPPPARGLGVHPWSYNASSLVFLESAKQHVCPSPGYQHQGGAPSHMPSWLPPPLHSLHRNGPMWFRNSVDPRSPPLLKTGHPTLHTLSPPSPPSPPGAASREVSPGTQRSCCGRVC